MIEPLIAEDSRVFRFGVECPTDVADQSASGLPWPTVEAVAVLLGRVAESVLAELPHADSARVERAGELLENYVTRVPNARIFHSLAWPGSATAEMDHAVLCGRRLVLVDSKRWEPGDYTFDSNGHLLRAGRPFLGSQVRFLDAVAAYKRVSVSASPWPNMRALTADGFLIQTCGWLAGQPDVIDTRAVALLWSMTNGPAPAGRHERKAGR